jgi:tRNA-Thr(GGU) m(6)t(6)A37 methyltransferase TsaA
MEDIIRAIAHIHTDFASKFGVPRQSGLVEALKGTIIFEPEYRNPDALRGIEGFSHIWLIWKFSETSREIWSPTVRPPRLGGSERMGVFATRSPFRPNAIGLSSVRLCGVQLHSEQGPVLLVAGADLMDKTPIYDIKPYLPYADSHPEAIGGFASSRPEAKLEVDFPVRLIELVPDALREALVGVLANDPRPSYQDDPERIYGFGFGGLNIKFRADARTLTVCDVQIPHA